MVEIEDAGRFTSVERERHKRGSWRSSMLVVSGSAQTGQGHDLSHFTTQRSHPSSRPSQISLVHSRPSSLTVSQWPSYLNRAKKGPVFLYTPACTGRLSLSQVSALSIIHIGSFLLGKSPLRRLHLPSHCNRRSASLSYRARLSSIRSPSSTFHAQTICTAIQSPTQRCLRRI
jgi:hypothetical protein